MMQAIEWALFIAPLRAVFASLWWAAGSSWLSFTQAVAMLAVVVSTLVCYVCARTLIESGD